MKKIFSLILIFNLFFITNVFAEETIDIEDNTNIPLSLIVADTLSNYSTDEFERKYRQAMEYIIDEEHYKEAYKLFKNIIKKDSNKERVNNSKYVLAKMYYFGLYVEKDYNKTFSLLDEILKDNDNSYSSYSDVLLLIGSMFFFGNGVDINFEKSISFIKESASLGNEAAITFLGKIEKENITEDNLGEKIYGLSNLTLFSKSENKLITTTNNLEIFQVLNHNIALAHMGYYPDRIVVLLIGDNDDYFYDGQKLKAPYGKKIKQIGIYKYESKGGMFKTVPAVAIK